MANPQRSASDPADVARADQREKTETGRALADLRAMFEHAPSRRVVWRWLSALGIFDDLDVQSARIHFLSGRRSAGLMIHADIAAANENLFPDLMKEMARAKRRRDVTADAESLEPA